MRFFLMLAILTLSGCVAAPAPQTKRPPTAIAYMNAMERREVATAVRRCWTVGREAQSFLVRLIVTTDQNGQAVQAEIAPGELSLPANAAGHAFAERAVRAVLNPQCSMLPIPQRLLGAPVRFDFVFRG